MAARSLNQSQGPLTCVHIITRMDKGGSAENTFLTVRDLQRQKYRPILIYGPTTESRMPPQEMEARRRDLQQLRDDGIGIMLCPHLVRRISLFHDCLAFFWLITTLRRLRPHIVHTHTSKAGILGRWAAFFNRVPIICHTPHGHVYYGYFGGLKETFFKWLERVTSLITHKIVCLTDGEKTDHLQFKIAPEHNFLVCPSGVDIKRINKGNNHTLSKEWQKRLGIHHDDLVIGTVGRLVEIKGPIFLLMAGREILAQKPEALFCFLGSGPLKEELETKAEAWGISHRVRFIPWEPDPAPILALYDIFVLPSLNEAMGRAIVEAMAMKKPVIATRIGGIPDLVHDGVNGLLVPPSHSSALAEAILRLADDPEMVQRMGRMSEQMAKGYSLEVMIKKIEEMYQDLLLSQGHVSEPQIKKLVYPHLSDI